MNKSKYQILIIGIISANEFKQLKNLIISNSDGFYFNIISTDKIKLSFFTDDLNNVENIYILFEKIESFKLSKVK